jgi:integrase
VQVPAPRAITATNQEREAILSAADPSLRCWLLLCSDLALRAKTAALIAPENYDQEARTITFVTKFGTAQTLPITNELADLFARATPGAEFDTPYVALLSRLGRISYETLQHKFARIRKRVGINRLTALGPAAQVLAAERERLRVRLQGRSE